MVPRKLLPFAAAGSAATAATGLNALDSNTTNYVNGDTIQITGTDADGSAIAATFTYGTDGTTLGSLVSVINAAFALGWRAHRGAGVRSAV